MPDMRTLRTVNDLIRKYKSLYEVYRLYLGGELPQEEASVVESEVDRNYLLVALACYLRK